MIRLLARVALVPNTGKDRNGGCNLSRTAAAGTQEWFPAAPYIPLCLNAPPLGGQPGISKKLSRINP